MYLSNLLHYMRLWICLSFNRAQIMTKCSKHVDFHFWKLNRQNEGCNESYQVTQYQQNYVSLKSYSTSLPFISYWFNGLDFGLINYHVTSFFLSILTIFMVSFFLFFVNNSRLPFITQSIFMVWIFYVQFIFFWQIWWNHRILWSIMYGTY